jgi:MYXO-CTERM domain-containing protein
MRVAWGLLLSLLVCARPAHPFESTPQPVTYTGTKNLFDDFSFDTGWVPAGAPIQVHFALFAGSGWSATLTGTGHLEWPEPVGIRMLGDPGGGLFHMSMGLQLVARLRVHLELPVGGTIDWEGDVPYVPNFDLRFAGDTTFDPFLLPGAAPGLVEVQDTIPPLLLFQVDLGSLIGVSIPGVTGGFELLAGGTMRAALAGVRFDVGDEAGTVLTTIAQEGAPSLVAPPAAGHLTLQPRYQATLHPTGTLDLVPAVFVEFAGNRWDLPLLTIPVPVVDSDFPWDFGSQTTRFPLPDINVGLGSLGFGTVPSGGTVTRELRVENRGELDLIVDATTDAAVFTVTPASVTVAPGSYETLTVGAVSPPGEVRGTLSLASNDPDEALVTVSLAASGPNNVEQTPGDGGVPPAATPRADVSSSGCCGVAGAAPGPAPGLAAALLALGLVGGRRRRRR